jgi:hypothetical protein
MAVLFFKFVSHSEFQGFTFKGETLESRTVEH